MLRLGATSDDRVPDRIGDIIRHITLVMTRELAANKEVDRLRNAVKHLQAYYQYVQNGYSALYRVLLSH